jgi:hypothetical protein
MPTCIRADPPASGLATENHPASRIAPGAFRIGSEGHYGIDP